MCCNAMLLAYGDAGQPNRGLALLMIMMRYACALMHTITFGLLPENTKTC
jgi:hypothetical protein